MKYRHREYTVPAENNPIPDPPGLRKVSEYPLSTLPGTMAEYEPIPSNSEIARVEAILYRLVPSVLTMRPSRARLAKRAAIQAAAREIVSGAYRPAKGPS